MCSPIDQLCTHEKAALHCDPLYNVQYMYLSLVQTYFELRVLQVQCSFLSSHLS